MQETWREPNLGLSHGGMQPPHWSSGRLLCCAAVSCHFRGFGRPTHPSPKWPSLQQPVTLFSPPSGSLGRGCVAPSIALMYDKLAWIGTRPDQDVGQPTMTRSSGVDIQPQGTLSALGTTGSLSTRYVELPERNPLCFHIFSCPSLNVGSLHQYPSTLSVVRTRFSLTEISPRLPSQSTAKIPLFLPPCHNATLSSYSSRFCLLFGPLSGIFSPVSSSSNGLSSFMPSHLGSPSLTSTTRCE